MALHVPKAPGFAQMLKEGAKVRGAPGSARARAPPGLLPPFPPPAASGLRGVSAWRAGKFLEGPAAPRGPARPGLPAAPLGLWAPGGRPGPVGLRAGTAF